MLGEFDISDDDQMFKVMRSQVDVVLPTGAAVLHAGDARIVEMAELCDGEVIFYSADPKAPAIAAHCAAGGRALYVRQDQVILATGTTEAFLPGLGKLSAWRKRRAIPQDALLAAVGAAWALGIPRNLIGAGLEAFESNQTPAGRAD